jgi:hypothetical protein
MITAGMATADVHVEERAVVVHRGEVVEPEPVHEVLEAVVGEFAVAEAGGDLAELDQPERHEAALGCSFQCASSLYSMLFRKAREEFGVVSDFLRESVKERVELGRVTMGVVVAQLGA